MIPGLDAKPVLGVIGFGVPAGFVDPALACSVAQQFDGDVAALVIHRTAMECKRLPVAAMCHHLDADQSTIELLAEGILILPAKTPEGFLAATGGREAGCGQGFTFADRAWVGVITTCLEFDLPFGRTLEKGVTLAQLHADMTQLLVDEGQCIGTIEGATPFVVLQSIFFGRCAVAGVAVGEAGDADQFAGAGDTTEIVAQPPSRIGGDLKRAGQQPERADTQHLEQQLVRKLVAFEQGALQRATENALVPVIIIRRAAGTFASG